MTAFAEFVETALILAVGAGIALLIGYSMLRLILGAMFRNLRRPEFATPMSVSQPGRAESRGGPHQ